MECQKDLSLVLLEISHLLSELLYSLYCHYLTSSTTSECWSFYLHPHNTIHHLPLCYLPGSVTISSQRRIGIRTIKALQILSNIKTHIYYFQWLLLESLEDGDQDVQENVSILQQ
jgi:hypothetical protein